METKRRRRRMAVPENTPAICRRSSRRISTPAKRIVAEKAATVLKGLSETKMSKEENLSRLLALKTAELEAERKETAAKFSAMTEQHQREMASVRAEKQNQVAELVATNQKLTEELAATWTPTAPATPQRHALPVSASPPSPSSPSTLLMGLKRQHPDMLIPELTPDRERRISQLSGGRIDRYGCFLFQAAVGTETYHSWCCNTNWTGGGGKWALPRNLQEYLLNALAEKFDGFGDRETRMVIDRVNELLRKPRLFLYV